MKIIEHKICVSFTHIHRGEIMHNLRTTKYLCLHCFTPSSKLQHFVN